MLLRNFTVMSGFIKYVCLQGQGLRGGAHKWKIGQLYPLPDVHQEFNTLSKLSGGIRKRSGAPVPGTN